MVSFPLWSHAFRYLLKGAEVEEWSGLIDNFEQHYGPAAIVAAELNNLKIIFSVNDDKEIRAITPNGLEVEVDSNFENGFNLLIDCQDSESKLADLAGMVAGSYCNGNQIPIKGLTVNWFHPVFPKPPAGVRCCAVLLCGGKGSRLAEQGISTHKPLMSINGKPSLFHVVEQLQNMELDFTSIIIVVPPERLKEYNLALEGRECVVVAQPVALGTGDAVWHALKHLPEEVEHVYVSFGTQPLVTDNSILASLAFHIKEKLEFTLPTTITPNPYAPLLRGADGKVSNSVETHLEEAEKSEFGEANVGGYWASMKALNEILIPLQKMKWNADSEKYMTSSGELGYPNEMVRACLEGGFGIDGIPCSEPQEMIGLKRLEDISKIELEFARRQHNLD
jgi:CTP:molybdopterin cytidylyltransferase MocA